MAVRAATFVYHFGPFALDSRQRRLTNGRAPIWLPDRHMDVLLALTELAGQVVSKKTLIDAAWKGLSVTDNSIAQAVRGLRNILGRQADGTPYIQTVMRRGYRFMALVKAGTPSPTALSTNVADTAEAANVKSNGANGSAGSPGNIDALIEPYRAFVEGRAALETLSRDAIARASHAFSDALRLKPGFAAAHVGLANACLLHFEATRSDGVPDGAALARAEHHARESCRLDPSFADAVSTFALIRHRAGGGAEAIAAARKAVALDRRQWRHHLRLAIVSWGDERLRAADEVLALCPGLALAHWFAATVFVAREAFDSAREQLRAGCVAQDEQRREGGRFGGLGLHLLHGLLLAATGATDEARDQLLMELEHEEPGQIYGRECAANTLYTLGALAFAEDRPDEASSAFQAALNRVPGHALAALGVSAAAGHVAAVPKKPAQPPNSANQMDQAFVRAAALSLKGCHDKAAKVCADTLLRATPGQAGWFLPVEPLLQVTAHREPWADALAMLRDRAF